jgi:hypothetical protein
MTKLAAKSEFASEAEQIRIGGVIDRDHHGPTAVQRMEREAGVHILAVHEVENLLLHPASLNIILAANGKLTNADELIQRASDQHSGAWITQRVALRNGWDLGRAVSRLAHGVSWPDIASDEAAVLQSFADGLPPDSEVSKEDLIPKLTAAAASYREMRDDPSRLWKEVHGKQVLRNLLPATGFTDEATLLNNLSRAWSGGSVPVPAELQGLRAYVGGL